MCVPLSIMFNDKNDSSIQHETIQFGMVYIDFKNPSFLLMLTFPDKFRYKILRVVSAFVGYYQKSCFVNLKWIKKKQIYN